MAVSRAGREVEVEIELEVAEHPDGTLVATRRHAAGGSESLERHRVGPQGVESVRRAGGGEQRDLAPRPPGEWLPPHAAAIHLAQRRLSGAREIRCRVLLLDGQPEAVELVSERIGAAEERFSHGGREIPATRWRTRVGEGGASVEELWSSDGWLLESEAATGAGRLRMTLVGEEEARRADGEPLPEVLAASVVPLAAPLPRRLPLALEIRPAAALGPRDGAEVLARLAALPASPRQRVEPSPGGVRVELLAAAVGGLCEPPTPRALAAAPLLETEDPEVRRLAERLGGGEGLAPAARAERLRRGVHRHIVRKDLFTTLAGAAETSRTRRGDCSEHAVLLAALLRVREIPARLAVGLDHSPLFAGRREVFAWHVWAQAWIDGRWEDLDATREDPRAGRRVLVATSELAGGASDPLWMAVLPLAGRIEIEAKPLEGPR